MNHEEIEEKMRSTHFSMMVLILMAAVTLVYLVLIFAETRSISESSQAEIVVTVERTSESEGTISIERLK